MLLHIKYLVYTKTTAGVAGGGRRGGCNLHSYILPRQLAACQPLRKLLNLGLARLWLWGWSRALSNGATTLSQVFLCWLHHLISTVVILHFCCGLPLCCGPGRAGCSAALKSAQESPARC